MNQTKKNGRRWVTPVLTLLIAGSAIAWLHFTERVESYKAAYAIPAIIVLSTVILLIWFTRYSRFSAKTRMRGGLAFASVVILGAIAIKATTRVDGVINGVGFPRLVWRWSPPGDRTLPTIAVTHEAVDLATTRPTDFPQFLGPGGRNAIEAIHLSRDWSHPPRQLWRQPIGAGWSSFAVVGNWAVTEEQRGDDELIVCYDVVTGKPVWAHDHPHTRFKDSQGGDGPRATPTIFHGRVYAMGATGILDCLDGATGNILWSRQVLSNPSRNLTYGKSDSPLIVDDKVIVTGGSAGPSLLAYGASDGTLIWSSGNESPGYASPILTTLAGVQQIVTVNAQSVCGHEATSGNLLWRFDWPGSMPKNIQPIPLDDHRLLISGGYGLGTTLLDLKSNGSAISVTQLWNSPRLKPKLTNNVIHGDYVFGFDDPGRMTCIQLSTSKRMWRDGDYGFGQLLGVDDLILIEAETGDVALVEANPQGLHELGRFTALQSRTWSGPTLAGHYLLVRNDVEAACFELP